MTLPQQAVLTVSQVAVHLRELLESNPFLSDLWIVGEVSNLRASSSGHSYFTLKDSSASLNCVLFRGHGGAGMLENGKSVRAHGRMSFYEPRGSTDFMVDRVLPEGEGALAQELERLKDRLGQEGLFEESRKRPLPQFPEVIGVVTSPSGAAWQDIQNVVRRRYPLARLLLSPTQVQGLEAAPQISDALDRLDSDGSSDVIIVARGGGSLEDLWPFNEEIVARAIFRNRIPVVSGVGHETDFTIADYVADRRAPTPSAAAELVVPDGSILRQTVQAWTERAWRGALRSVESSRGDVANLARRLESGLPDVDHLKRQVDDLAESLGGSFRGRLRLARLEVDGLEGRLRTLDPAATLRRGFAMVQRGDTGQVVSTMAQVSDGEPLTITVADGSFPATVGDGTISPPATAPTASPADPVTDGKTAAPSPTPAPPGTGRRNRRRPPEPPPMERLI
ncbi:MAG: exodeoxyribonuclease VII large subunit [Chloroflexota bacterium]|nr:exodeoxyribonuclease VII large subunit [Chloroflexota bacterium]